MKYLALVPMLFFSTNAMSCFLMDDVSNLSNWELEEYINCKQQEAIDQIPRRQPSWQQIQMRNQFKELEDQLKRIEAKWEQQRRARN